VLLPALGVKTTVFSSQQVRRMLAHGLTEEDDDQPAG